MNSFKSVLGAAAAAVVIGAPMSAQATPVIEILYDNAQVLICTDQTGCDLSGALGAVLVTGGFGVFSLTIDSGITKPAVTFPELMDLAVSGTVNNNTGVAHTLEVRFSETQFTQGGAVSGSYTNNNTNTVGTASAWYGAANTLFDLNTLIGTTTPAPNGGHGTFDGVIATSPYSLTTSLLFTAAAGQSGTLSSDFRLTVPEPGALALVSLALLGAGLASRRRG